MHSLGKNFRTGHPLPDIGTEPSLQQVGEALLRTGVVVDHKLETADGRTFAVVGVLRSRRPLAAIEISESTVQARKLAVERQFIVDAAHEILSPLTTITSSAHVLQEGAKHTPETRDRFIDHIAKAAQRLTWVSRALLTLARAESGIEPPRVEPIELGALLQDLAEDKRNGPVEIVISCPAGLHALADRDLLHLSLSVLVENACRHTRSDQIELTARTEADSMIAIEITDAGRGILAADLGRVTQKFVRQGGRESDGFGLGLSIAERALRIVDGTLLLASSPAGTTVTARVPLSEQPS